LPEYNPFVTCRSICFSITTHINDSRKQKQAPCFNHQLDPRRNTPTQRQSTWQLQHAHSSHATSSRPSQVVQHPTCASHSPPTVFTASTNSDGRVTAWQSTNESGTVTTTELDHLVNTLKSDLKSDEQMNWSLVFATEEFYGKGKTFWPEVELKFCTHKDERHYHVPLLLGPWSYTTYRGS
jgi:5-hydroxyisourate hydrolase